MLSGSGSGWPVQLITILFFLGRGQRSPAIFQLLLNLDRQIFEFCMDPTKLLLLNRVQLLKTFKPTAHLGLLLRGERLPGLQSLGSQCALLWSHVQPGIGTFEQLLLFVISKRIPSPGVSLQDLLLLLSQFRKFNSKHSGDA